MNNPSRLIPTGIFDEGIRIQTVTKSVSTPPNSFSTVNIPYTRKSGNILCLYTTANTGSHFVVVSALTSNNIICFVYSSSSTTTTVTVSVSLYYVNKIKTIA